MRLDRASSVRLLALLVPALSAGISVPSLAADSAQGREEPTELGPITVTRQVSPLDEPYDRLRKMMEDPHCDGCPPLIQVDRETVYSKAGKVVGAVTGYGPTLPDPSHEDRLDFHIANDWRQAERLPEN